MKRSTPLKRGKPLKRGSSTLKRSRLKPVSDYKLNWRRSYADSKKDSVVNGFVRCASTGLLCRVETCDPHHPMGRCGRFILCYVWMLKSEHRKIHDFGKQSRACGWLLAPYEGKPYDPQEHRAWDAPLEAHWPEDLKRPVS